MSIHTGPNLSSDVISFLIHQLAIEEENVAITEVELERVALNAEEHQRQALKLQSALEALGVPSNEVNDRTIN